MRRPTLFGVLLALASSLPLAAATARYRIVLADGNAIIASDLPVRRGSVVTFHPESGGALTGVPAESVARIENGSFTVTPATEPELDSGIDRVLEPGEALDLGEMGEGIAAAEAPAPARVAAPAALPPQYYGGNAGAYGAGGQITPNGTLLGPDGLPRAASSTDLARMASTLPATVAPNGFPSTGAPTVIGPDGTPTLAPGTPGSGTPVIGPNGTPVLASGPQAVIGPNGTPVMAPGAQTVIGPNGTPILAPGAQTVIGPNGTPLLAPVGAPGAAGPVIGPNGTPVLAPVGMPGSARVSVAPNGFPSAPAH